MEKLIRKTRSLCPVCLENLPAELWQEEDGSVTMKKSCPKHGSFEVPVWRGRMDFESWIKNEAPLASDAALNCPKDCGICAGHKAGSCCVLLEVTKRCDLRCRFCFANGGVVSDDPSFSDLKKAVDEIVEKCGGVLLQLSGGEPSMRDDLPELVSYAKKAGCSYVQLNTNGLRLARDEAYVRALRDAGLDIVFLQFDGTGEEIYKYLRGAPLLEQKKKAIELCGRHGLGVTLVPTLVPGVNTADIGELLRFAVDNVPAVRGVHFQPVSYFGRIPEKPENARRYTLDELMGDISEQFGIAPESFMPSRCDHALCGFHADFIVRPDGSLRALTKFGHSSEKRGSARDNREYVARHWRRQPEEKPVAFAEEMDFDAFLYHIRQRSLCLSAMAFQDAENLNLERLQRCTLHVYNEGKIKPFCANYLTKME